VRIHEKNNPADTEVSEEGGGRGAPGARADDSPAVRVKSMVKQAVLLQSVEVHSRTDIHPEAQGGPHAGAGG